MQNSISKIPVQVFIDYVVEKLRKSNPFLAFSVDESAKVLGGAVVHIPQSGASPKTVKNRSTFPATAVKREDSFITYALNEYSTDPTHVTWHEENEISYDKTDSVLNDHVETLMEVVGDDMIYSWFTGFKTDGKTPDVIPQKNVVFTSGASRAVFEEGQTGNRKKLTYKDIQNLAVKFNKANVKKQERYLMLESNMYQELIESLSENQMAAFQAAANVEEGVVGKLCGFKVMDRSTVAYFTSSGTPIVPGAALSATDCVGGIAWQKDCVARALGDIVPFQDLANPMYYGDIFSALVKAGGRCRRADWAGVCAIVEGTAA